MDLLLEKETHRDICPHCGRSGEQSTLYNVCELTGLYWEVFQVCYSCGYRKLLNPTEEPVEKVLTVNKKIINLISI